MNSLVAEYRLDRFPAEFEKNVWQDFDRRFVTIIFSSWLTVYTLAVVLGNLEYDSSLWSDRAREDYLRMIRETSTVRFLDPAIAEPESDETMSGPDTDVFPPAAVDPSGVDERAGADQRPSAVEMINQRRSSGAQREATRRQMETEVAGVGVLALLSAGGGGGGSGEAILDGLDGSGSGKGDLEQILSGVGRLASAGDRREHTVLHQRVGSERITGSAGVEELLSGLGSAGSMNIERKGSIRLVMAMEGISGSETGRALRSQDEISGIIGGHTAAVEYCYKKEAKLNPNLAGFILVEFVIAANGRVKGARIIQSSLQSQVVEGCITGRIRGWRFKPISNNAGDVVVRQKYIFG